MNLDLLFAVIFYGIILILFFRYRERFIVQGKIFALYKTKLGINLMEKIAKFSPRFWKVFGFFSIGIGFIGMVIMLYQLLIGSIKLITVPQAAPAVAPVLPGIKILPGFPVLSFWHWIISIFVVAVIHEFFHGIYARLYNVKVQSSGFAFLGPILAAFVEPNEKDLAKRNRHVQLAVFSAGPFSNLILGVVFFLVINFLTGPLYVSLYEGDGITVAKLAENYPAYNSGAKVPFTIMSVNNIITLDIKAFLNATKDIKPGDEMILGTDKGEFKLKTVPNPENATKPFIGISGLDQKVKLRQDKIDEYGMSFVKTYSWIHLLFFWLFVLSIGVGLFNLLPLGPIDGGRMLLAGISAFFNAKKSKKIWGFFTLFCLLLIFINLVPFLWKLLVFLFKPIVAFIV